MLLAWWADQLTKRTDAFLETAVRARRVPLCPLPVSSARVSTHSPYKSNQFGYGLEVAIGVIVGATVDILPIGVEIDGVEVGA